MAAALFLPAIAQTTPATERPAGPAAGDEKANHNTARSNKSSIAAPGGPQTGAGDAKANHNTIRSSKNKGGRRTDPGDDAASGQDGSPDTAPSPN